MSQNKRNVDVTLDNLVNGADADTLHEYWYNKGYDNGYAGIDDSGLTIPAEYSEDYGEGALDGDMDANPEEYESDYLDGLYY